VQERWRRLEVTPNKEYRMGSKQKILALSTLLFVAACGRGEVPPPDRVIDDLSWMDTITYGTPVASPIETGLAEAEPEAPRAVAPAAAAPRPAAQRSSTAQRSSAGTYRTPAPAPAPRTETVRNTGRDAAIGAGAGAVIGAVAGGKRHRVKGAIIGGAAGAVIGGVIGHTVDKKERVVHP
jgi:hypothetical protein